MFVRHHFEYDQYICSWASQTPVTINILKACDESYSKIIGEHKYKDKDNGKDNDKSKDTDTDMEFVQKFTPPDFQNFTPSISTNFNSFSKKKTQKMSENGEIYTAGKNFTLPPAL